MSRYDRLLSLSGFTKDKLSLLQSKKILLIGVGGVGQHIGTYLVTNGILDLTIVDFDKVELSNLNRQILLTEDDIGHAKVDIVKRALEAKNSEADIKSLNSKVLVKNASKIIDGFDYVIDAVDNWQSKLVISKTCKEKKIPLLHVGVDGRRGQFCLFIDNSLSDIVSEEILSSPKDGVSGPMVGIISSMAAQFLIKYIVGESDSHDTLFHYDDTVNVP